MLNRLKKPNNEGFTIIEVMIVLAIAGLILLIVFLAVPALQRSSRNTQRRSDVSHVAGLINEYVSNNAGQLPAGLTVKGTANSVDLSTENLAIINKPTSSADITFTDASSGYTAPATPALDTLYLYKGATCSNNAVTGNASSRSAVIVFYSEPGKTPQCAQV